MNELGKPIWMHPARGAEMPDYLRREEIALRDLVDARLVLRDRRRDDRASSSRRSWTTIPNLKIITHHFGGIVPMLEGRLGPGNDVMGSRTSDEDYVALRKSLKKRPLDYFKQDF